MTSAAKAPPQIAPGIKCPKCGGNMLDERANKRTEKSPDYTCANMLCTDPTGKYRTAIWAKDANNGATSGTAASAAGSSSSVGGAAGAEPPTEKIKLTQLYLDASKFVLEKIVPLYTKAEIGCSDQGVAAMVATLFIAATKER